MRRCVLRALPARIVKRRRTKMTVKKYLKESIRVGDRDLTVEVGHVAKQADGSCVIRYGDTMVLCAAVGALTPREGIDFFRSPWNIAKHSSQPDASPEITSGAKDVLMKRKF